MRGITWKKCYGGFEGFCKDSKYNNKAIFSIQGCSVCDLRESRFSNTFILPKYYLGKDTKDRKRIAEDLYNNINLEDHEQNRYALLEESKKLANLLEETKQLLNKLIVD